MFRFLWALLALMSLSLPLLALQGTGTGTLPVHRTWSALQAGQVLAIEHGEASLFIVSPFPMPDDAVVTPPDVPQSLSTPWRCRGNTYIVTTPRYANESTDEGAARWRDRHEQALEAAQRRWPPDNT